MRFRKVDPPADKEEVLRPKTRRRESPEDKLVKERLHPH